MQELERALVLHLRNYTNKTATMELSKNSYLEKVIEVEDQSMRTIDAKLIDIANLERLTNQICSDDNPYSNTEECAQESFTDARFNVTKTPIDK